jgi:hypothetical protein
MKEKVTYAILCWLYGLIPALGQEEILVYLQDDGMLTIVGAEAGTMVNIEYSHALGGVTSWEIFKEIMSTEYVTTVHVPMHYRVRGIPAQPVAVATVSS